VPPGTHLQTLQQVLHALLHTFFLECRLHRSSHAPKHSAYTYLFNNQTTFSNRLTVDLIKILNEFLLKKKLSYACFDFSLMASKIYLWYQLSCEGPELVLVRPEALHH
jgi:hypothetical protein